MSYRLLDKFRNTFSGVRYLHRSSLLGDLVAMELYEDLQVLRRSHLLSGRVERGERVLNVQNRVRGIRGRRGDGTFGELVPGVEAIRDPGFLVARGPIATVEIGAEVKILSKAMLKQIDRVIGDLTKQAAQFRQRGAIPICVGIVGINYAAVTTSYEKDRVWITDGKHYKHPLQEAASAERRLEEARSSFDEFLVLRYRASNAEPYPFEWVNLRDSKLDYGSILTRVSALYDRRFP